MGIQRPLQWILRFHSYKDNEDSSFIYYGLLHTSGKYTTIKGKYLHQQQANTDITRKQIDVCSRY